MVPAKSEVVNVELVDEIQVHEHAEGGLGIRIIIMIKIRIRIRIKIRIRISIRRKFQIIIMRREPWSRL